MLPIPLAWLDLSRSCSENANCDLQMLATSSTPLSTRNESSGVSNVINYRVSLSQTNSNFNFSQILLCFSVPENSGTITLRSISILIYFDVTNTWFPVNRVSP